MKSIFVIRIKSNNKYTLKYKKMESWQFAVIIGIVIILIYSWKLELFGESIYLVSDVSIKGDSDKRPAVFTAGATQRNLGQLFSATNQDTERIY